MKRILILQAALLLILPVFASGAEKKKEPPCEMQIVTEPAQAGVVLNRKDQAITPAVLRVFPGQYLLVIAKEGYTEARRTVVVEPQQTKMLVEVKLEPIRGLVLLDSSPGGADVTIEDAQRGRTPLLITDLTPGRYRVRAVLAGHLPVDKVLEVVGRTPQKLVFDLRPNSAAVSFTSEPPGADVAINGAVRGQTPCSVSGIRPGECTATVSLKGYRPYQETLRVQAGDDLTRHAILQPVPGTLEVQSIPTAGTVYVNNQRRGQTPLTLDNLEPGDYRVRVEMAGYEPLARDVAIKMSEPVVEEFRLARNICSLEIITVPAGVRVTVDGADKGVTVVDESATNSMSAPFLIEDLTPGQHEVQFIRKGYEKGSATVTVEQGNKAQLSQELKRIFAPDTLIRTGDGPDDVYIGYLVERLADGGVKLELKQGVFRVFKKSQIKVEKQLSVDGTY